MNINKKQRSKNSIGMIHLLTIIFIITTLSFSINANISNFNMNGDDFHSLIINLDTDSDLYINYELKSSNGGILISEITGPSSSHQIKILDLIETDNYKLSLTVFENTIDDPKDILLNYDFTYSDDLSFNNPNTYSAFININDFKSGIQTNNVDAPSVSTQTNDADSNINDPVSEPEPTIDFFNQGNGNTNEVDQTGEQGEVVTIAGNDKISNLVLTPSSTGVNIKFNTWKDSRVIIDYQPEFYDIKKLFVEGDSEYELQINELFSNTNYLIKIKACDLNDLNTCNTISSQFKTTTSSTSGTSDFDVSYLNVNGTIGNFLILNINGTPGTRLAVYKNKNFDIALYDQLSLSPFVLINENGTAQIRIKNTVEGAVTYTVLGELNNRVSSFEINANVLLKGPGLEVAAIPPLTTKVFGVSGRVDNPSNILIKVNGELFGFYETKEFFNHTFDFTNILEEQEQDKKQKEKEDRNKNRDNLIEKIDRLQKEVDENPTTDLTSANNEILELQNQLRARPTVSSSTQRISKSEPVNIQFFARDNYGTIEVVEYVIIIDDQPPILQFDDNVKAIMKGTEEVLFPIQRIKGNAGEPFAKLIIVNEGDGTNTVSEFVFDGSKGPVQYTKLTDGKILKTINEQALDFEVQTFDELKGGTVAGDVAARLKKYIKANKRKHSDSNIISAYSYIDLSLSQQLRKWLTPIQDSDSPIFEVVADANGDFEFNLLLYGGENPNAPSLNRVNILAIDPAGNFVHDIYPLKFIRGTSLWTSRAGEQFPTVLTVTDLKDTGVEAVLHYELQYNGPSPDRLENVKVASPKKTDRSPNSKYYDLSGRVLSKYNKKDGTLFVEVPVKFRKVPKNTEVFDIPKSIDIKGFITVTASVDDPNLDPEIVSQISSGRVAIKNSMAIDHPEDVRKFLNPELIKKGLKVLNDTHEFLADAIDKTKKIATANTAACGLYAFMGNFISVDMESFFWVCDRVACPYVPDKCELLSNVDNAKYPTKYYKNDKVGDNLRVSFIENPGDNDGDKKEASTFLRSLNYGGKLPECSDGQNIVVRRSEVSAINAEGASKGHPLLNKVFNTQIETDARCAQVGSEEFANSNFQFQPTGNEICYSRESPQYDNVKCFDNSFHGEPANNLLSSLRCGCVSGVFGNLQKYDRIVNQMNRCLREVQLGRIEGAACEEIFSVYVCDLLASGFKKVVQTDKKVINQNDNGKRPNNMVSGALDSLEKSQTITQFFSDRYQGSGLSTKFSVNSDGLVNKLCQAAITGNYDDLSAVFESTINVNVPPTAFLVGARSRLHSFSKISRSMNIKYDVTGNIFSGGTPVKYWIQLQCDRDASNGEYCPSNIDKNGGQLTIRSGTLSKNQDLDSRFTYVDKNAKFWYNKAIMHLSYKHNNKEEAKSQVKSIERLGDVHFECSFSPEGFRCGSFDGVELGEIKIAGSPARGIHFEPKGSSVFYAGTEVKGSIELETIGYTADDLFVKVEQMTSDNYEGPVILEDNPSIIKVDNLEITGENKFIFDIGAIPIVRSDTENSVSGKWEYISVEREGDSDYSSFVLEDDSAFRKKFNITSISDDTHLGDQRKNYTIEYIAIISSGADEISQATIYIDEKDESIDSGDNYENKDTELFLGNDLTIETDIRLDNFRLRVENVRLSNPELTSAGFNIIFNICDQDDICIKYTRVDNLQFSKFKSSKKLNIQNLEFKVSLVRDIDGNGEINLDGGDEVVSIQENGKEKKQQYTLKGKWNPRERTDSDCMAIKPQVNFESIETGNTLCMANSDQLKLSVYHSCGEPILNRENMEAKLKLKIGSRLFESEDLADKFEIAKTSSFDGIEIDDLMGIEFIETKDPVIIGTLTPLRNIIPPDRVKTASSVLTAEIKLKKEVANNKGEFKEKTSTGIDRINVYFSERADLCD